MGRALKVARATTTGVLVIATAACAGEAESGVTAEDGVIAAPVAEGPASMYLTIVNTGPTADTLIAVHAPAGGSTAIHQQASGPGILTRMEPLTELEIPGDTTIAMEPGGLHVMLEGEGQVTPGDTLAIELIFRRAGSLTVSALVVSYQELQEKLTGGRSTAHH